MESSVYRPKQADHPRVGRPCPLCENAFREGDFTVLVPVRAADDEEEGRRAEGLRYLAEAVEVHRHCRDEARAIIRAELEASRRDEERR